MKLKRIGLIFIMSSLAVFSQAQVNAVEFGKNRVQHKMALVKFNFIYFLFRLGIL